MTRKQDSSYSEEWRAIAFTGYYLAERYPFLGGAGITSEQIARDRAEARELITALFPDEKLDQ